MSISADDITRTASEVARERATTTNTRANAAVEAYKQGYAGGPDYAAQLAALPRADQDDPDTWAQNFLSQNYRARMPQPPGQWPGAELQTRWSGIDVLQKQLTLAGYMQFDAYRYLKQHNMIGTPEALTLEALKRAQADAQHSGLSVDQLLAQRARGASMAAMGSRGSGGYGGPSGPVFRPMTEESVQALGQQVGQHFLGRDLTAEEMAKFKPIFRQIERGNFNKNVTSEGQAKQIETKYVQSTDVAAEAQQRKQAGIMDVIAGVLNG